MPKCKKCKGVIRTYGRDLTEDEKVYIIVKVLAKVNWTSHYYHKRCFSFKNERI